MERQKNNDGTSCSKEVVSPSTEQKVQNERESRNKRIEDIIKSWQENSKKRQENSSLSE
jgi:hypothetical protein